MEFKSSNGVERLFRVELKRVEGRWRAWVDFESGREVIGSCPVCGGDVVETPLSFGCSRWSEGCEFAIFKNSLKRFGGKMLDKRKAGELLKNGVTQARIRGFDGSYRSVRVSLDNEFGCRVEFE